MEEHKIALFGAITSKPKQEAAKELAPELQGKGLVYSSPIVGLRQYFKLEISLRPCRTYEGNPLNFIRRSKDGGFEEPAVNVAIFRQNTEGLYSGVEWSNPPEQVYNAFMTHPKFAKNYGNLPKEDIAISSRIFTRGATERILRAAFEYARKYDYKSVTVAEKPNVIRETSGMMYQMAKDMQQKDYPEITLRNVNIDAMTMWLTKNPEDYGVIVSGNMFGDIVSDGFAGLIGGLGFAASAQYNPQTRVAVFEPTHGSAPKYAEYQTPIVNPIAMIEAARMMLEYIGEQEKADRIRKAIAKVVKDGKVKTYDMLKLKGSPDVIKQGAASTIEMTDAIIANL